MMTQPGREFAAVTVALGVALVCWEWSPPLALPAGASALLAVWYGLGWLMLRQQPSLRRQWRGWLRSGLIGHSDYDRLCSAQRQWRDGWHRLPFVRHRA